MLKQDKGAVNVEKVTNSRNDNYRHFFFFCETCKVLVQFKVLQSHVMQTVCGRESFRFVLLYYQPTSCELLPLWFNAADTVPGLTIASEQGGRHTELLETMYNGAWELLCNFLISNNVLKLKESG